MTLTLSTLMARAEACTLDELYAAFGYDYSRSVTFDDPGSDLDRDRFVRSLAWRTPPTLEHVKRLFNQINSFYAERWLFAHSSSGAAVALAEVNRLLLFRQGKALGPRTRRIGYGYRLHLDFMDPRRRMKWLAGAGPSALERLLMAWSNAAERCNSIRANAIVLAMFLIAIHPYVDGNGRAARLMYSWLCERWGLRGKNWFEEGSDGELLRTGHGSNSTEYLMAQVMIAFGGGANVIDPGSGGRRTVADDAQLASRLADGMCSLASGDDSLLSEAAVVNLIAHLEAEGHLRDSSPRFESLHSLLQ